MTNRFSSLLVANRGEIACRIIRSAAALGLETVAVFSDADRGARHVAMADRAVRLGPAPAKESYLRADAVLEAALGSGAGAIHPGYGFLSEDAPFAASVEAAGLVFVGPTPMQLELFGTKHTAREAAQMAGVPMLPGTGLLPDAEAAVAAAEALGYPVMLKATGGGGGMGIVACASAAEVLEAFESVTRVAGAGFRTSGVYLERLVERARHVEVQIVGDGRGQVVVLGDRDCSLQRRNQKVVEEAPAPGLTDEVRGAIADASRRLAESVSYRSAGTVEFVYDADRHEAAFLEVNTRLQVEHPVTEEIFGIDLVAAMLRVAQGDEDILGELRAASPAGAAIEVRLYAEDPSKDYQPSPGTITEVAYPDGVRVDGWVEAGTEVTAAYDPLLAKLIVSAPTRDEAISRLTRALEATRIGGIETNREFVIAALGDPAFHDALHTTSTLGAIADPAPRIEVLSPGTQTTVQSWPGRLGYWHIGVPPSGPMDDRSLRLGNLILGNEEGAPGLEMTLVGATLAFSATTVICVAGAPCEAAVDGASIPLWEPIEVQAGSTLVIGSIGPPGIRAYLLVEGGLDVPGYLGSGATFILGAFGGHAGRPLRSGDVLRSIGGGRERSAAAAVATPEPAVMGDAWELAVLPGPHADAEFFTKADLDRLYETKWEVHFNSARTGLRLVGPRPDWARSDGGEAGLHPSNIHDTPYSVGAVNYTGDLPILLGPDGPSLGGFVCPATVVTDERWKLGQLRPGDTVRFVPTSTPPPVAVKPGRGDARSGILERRAAGSGPMVTYRANGDDNLLVEYGPMVLDLALRARVQGLSERIEAEHLDGVVELTPGVRGLQVKFDPTVTDLGAILDSVGGLEESLPPSSELEVPSREIHLPLSWDDPAIRESIERYQAGVRADAPWCPSNIEFIRRINGLTSIDEVRQTVFDATYVVLGLGDVYLGAPLATPLDPRHRLVTTKYNPARTSTAQNAVGIGGAYLCIYGMEGPGGYQLVGRTVQIWSHYAQRSPFEPDVPWLLRFFDRIRWYPVSADELLEARADMAAGRLDVEITEGTFNLAEHEAMLKENADSISSFQQRQAAAYAAERLAWEAAGEFDAREDLVAESVASGVAAPPGGALIEAPMTANVWKVVAEPGAVVEAGEVLLILEAMKTEIAVVATQAGIVSEVLVAPGSQVSAGQVVAVLGARG